jgi:hypothetical protein
LARGQTGQSANVAATIRNTQAMVKDGQFRQDLYYRLSAFPVNVPSLRERKDDILASLADGDRYVPLSPEVIETMLGYDYPGNVRELAANGGKEHAALCRCISSHRAGRCATRLYRYRGQRRWDSKDPLLCLCPTVCCHAYHGIDAAQVTVVPQSIWPDQVEATNMCGRKEWH